MLMKKFTNFTKKIFIFFLIFNLTFVSTAQAAGVFVDSFDISNEETVPTGLAFNNDGTKMFVTGKDGDDVNEYTLSTAFDVSTASFVDSFDVSGEEINPGGLAFNNNGTKMFVVGQTGDDINEYTLSTAFDVSTASYAGNSERFNFSSQEGKPGELVFNNDGTKMFLTGNGGDDVNEYTLSTAFDVSTASFVDSFLVRGEESDPRGLAFNNNGTKMFVTGFNGDEVNEYTLSTAFDVSTATFLDSLDVSSEDTVPSSLKFNSDGTKMFVLGQTGDDVNEYTLSCPFKVTSSSTCDDPADTSDEGKDITSSIESQTATAKQIAIQASTPVLNRMYWLRRHRTNDKLSNQNIKFNFSNSMMASLSKVIPVSNKKTNDALDKLSDNWSFWSEGSVSVGKVGDTSSSSSKKIDSKGITIGMDKKISENKMYGYALRFGNDYVDVGTSGTSLDTNSYSLSLYGTFPHDDKRFTEGILGISTLKTDHVRKSDLYTRTGQRDGAQVFGSINYFTTYKKDEFNIVPNIRIDLSYTELSKYRETGTAALVYKKQTIETGMISSGFTISDIINLNTMTFKPNGGLEIGLDFSPSSDATYRYLSETTEYTKSIGQDAMNVRANIGFDLVTENGFSIMTIYERNQSDNGHSDTLYLGFGYIPTDDIEYAMSLDNDKASLNYKRDLNGFDIRISSNYNLMSKIPDYGAAIEVSRTF